MSQLLHPLFSLVSSIGPFFILLGILIFVHELGHFSVAKFFGVRVEVFSLGFGKKILSFKRGDTTYCISIIPLGGYVKMFGDDPTSEIADSEKQYAFLKKPVMQRFAVVLAGPLMNLIFAFFIYGLIANIGEEVPGPIAGDVAPNTAAYYAGFRSGDKILKVNDAEVSRWAQIQEAVESGTEQTIRFSVQHATETQVQEITATPGPIENDNIFSTHHLIGQIQGLSQESRASAIGVTTEKSPARLAGLDSLAVITSVGDKKITYWRELLPALKEHEHDTQVQIQARHFESFDKDDSAIKTHTLDLPKGWASGENPLVTLGFESAELYVAQLKKGSPAEKAGMLMRDRIVKIGNDSLSTWSDVLEHVKKFDPAQESLKFTVSREGQGLKEFNIRPEMTTLMTAKGKEEHRFTIGIISGYFPVGTDAVLSRTHDPIEVCRRAAKETVYWTEFVVMSLVRLVQGDVSAKNIGGVITIARVSAHSFAAGITPFLRMMGLISINLFLLNLLPVPVLDGGHLVFYSIEALRGAPLSMRKMEIAQQVGLVLLMSLMAFAFYNDITNLWATKI